MVVSTCVEEILAEILRMYEALVATTRGNVFTTGSSRNKYVCPLAVASHPDHTVTRGRKVIADTDINFATNGILIRRVHLKCSGRQASFIEPLKAEQRRHVLCVRMAGIEPTPPESDD